MIRNVRSLAALAAAATLLVASPANTEASTDTVTDSADTTPPPSEASVVGSTANSAGGALDELAAAAADEGTVVWYGAYTQSDADRVIAAFEEAYPGISVEYLRLASGDLSQRFATEKDSGAPTADVVSITDPVFVGEALANGWFTALADADVPGYPDEYPEQFRMDDIGSAVTSVTMSIIGYNTDLVSEDEAPTSWDDLLDPRWKGEILIPDPSSTASYIGTWTALETVLGDDYLAALAAQDPRFVPGGAVPTTELLVAGEGSIIVPGLGSPINAAAAEGAPVAFVLPEVTAGPQALLGINSEPAHPNAARLLAAFILSEEGNAVLASEENAVLSPYDAADAPVEVIPVTLDYFDNADQILSSLGLG